MNGLPRWFWLLLAASVALNLFCAGAWAGRHFSAFAGGHHRGGAGLRMFLRHGLENDDPVVQHIVQAHRAQVRARMHALARARAGVRDALLAEPFDPNAFAGALDAVKARTSDMQAEVHATMRELATKLDPQARRRMAEAMWNRPHPNRGCARTGPP